MYKETTKRILSSLVLIPLALFFILKGSFFFNFFLFICFFVTAYEWYQMTKSKKYCFFGIIFLVVSFYSVYLLRNDSQNYGILIFLLISLTCVSTDIGGYIFGNFFKGPKLTKISPNKTYSGMFGGFFLSIICNIIFIEYSYLFSGTKIIFTSKIFILIILISLVSQFGDLTISYFKRLSKIKNTGKIIPGHGGLLDRIDGMIFAFPFSFFLLKIL